MTDTFNVRIVLIALAGLTSLCVVAAVVLQLGDHDAAQAWQAAGTFGGGLVAMLVSTKSQPDPIVQQAVHDAHAAGVGAGVEAGKAEVIDALTDPAVVAVTEAAKRAKG